VVPEGKNPYDHLKLAAVVEFGLNYGKEHVRGDIQRLAHADSNVGLRLAANLYRFTTAADRFCGRDWSPKARSICNRADLLDMLQEHPGVVVYYGVAGGAETGVWRLSAEGEKPLVQDFSLRATSADSLGSRHTL
jgi:hypothetical protein